MKRATRFFIILAFFFGLLGLSGCYLQDRPEKEVYAPKHDVMDDLNNDYAEAIVNPTGSSIVWDD